MQRDVCTPGSWSSEVGYYSHLGEDASEGMVAVTPSGSSTRQETPWYQTLIQTAVPALTTAYQQNQLNKLNIARINTGQPPLTATQYAQVYQPPSARVEVGPTPTAQKWLLGAAAAGLLFLGLKAAKVIR